MTSARRISRQAHLGYHIVACEGGWTIHRSVFGNGPHVPGIFATPYRAKRAIEARLFPKERP